jgi:O-methyltransferase
MLKLFILAYKFAKKNLSWLIDFIKYHEHDEMILNFIHSPIGHDYQLDEKSRFELVKKFRYIDSCVPGRSGTAYFITLAKEILSIPPDSKGDLIECGCFQGKSTCFLSILAKITSRRLLVCDSFEGLPPESGDMKYTAKYHGHIAQYAKGDFSCSLSVVQSNIKQFGNLEVCEFVKGFFSESLKNIKNKKFVFAFIDVDLISSTKECLLYIWPNLLENGKIFNDDMGVVEIEKLYFNDAWWQENFKENSPGVVGSGCGFSGFHSLGYCLKKNNYSQYPVYKGTQN